MKPLLERVLVEETVFSSDDIKDMDHIKKVSDIEMYCVESFGHGEFALREFNQEFSVLKVNEHGEYENIYDEYDLEAITSHINPMTWKQEQLDRLKDYISYVPYAYDCLYLFWLEAEQWSFWSISEKKDGMVTYYDIFALPDVNEVIKCKLMI